MAETLEQMADAELIAAVRQGDVAAFGALYERHLSAAKRAAACLARTHTEREDLVAEAFTRVLRMLREGRGPDEEFRPYLLVTLRNAAIHSAVRGTAVSLYADVPDAFVAEDYVDPVIDRWNAGVAVNAFASLPERWRMVLWHTEVEKESPAEVAPLLGMRPNSVAALAYRAREGLRQAYLRMHVPGPPRPECVPTVNKLAGYVRHSVPPPLTRKIRRHLDRCQDCRARADVLSKVNAEIAGVLGPLVLGAPLAAAYLQTPVTAVTAAVAASAAADTGLATGVLAMKTSVLKAGAAVLVAATAATTTAATPVVSPPADPAPIRVVDGAGGSSFTVPGGPSTSGVRQAPPRSAPAEKGNRRDQGGPPGGPSPSAGPPGLDAPAGPTPGPPANVPNPPASRPAPVLPESARPPQHAPVKPGRPANPGVPRAGEQPKSGQKINGNAAEKADQKAARKADKDNKKSEKDPGDKSRKGGKKSAK